MFHLWHYDRIIGHRGLKKYLLNTFNPTFENKYKIAPFLYLGTENVQIPNNKKQKKASIQKVGNE